MSSLPRALQHFLPSSECCLRFALLRITKPDVIKKELNFHRRHCIWKICGVKAIGYPSIFCLFLLVLLCLFFYLFHFVHFTFFDVPKIVQEAVSQYVVPPLKTFTDGSGAAGLCWAAQYPGCSNLVRPPANSILSIRAWNEAYLKVREG